MTAEGFAVFMLFPINLTAFCACKRSASERCVIDTAGASVEIGMCMLAMGFGGEVWVVIHGVLMVLKLYN